MKRLYGFIELIALWLTFFGLIVPIAMFLRLRKSDPLNRKLNGAQKSYWIERVQVELTPKSFYSQFIKK